MKTIQINGFEFQYEIQNQAISQHLASIDINTLSDADKLALKATIINIGILKSHYSLN